jgi:glycosyltransferase involved in cell wall biosynthesis
MRILMMHWRFDAFGGGEAYLAEISRRLSAAGHEVVIASGASYGGSQFAGDFRHLTLPESSGIRSGLREKRVVLDAVDDIAPDAIHFHHVDGFLSPMVEAAVRRDYPCVKTLHDVSVVCPLGNEMIKQYRGQPCTYRFDFGCITRGCYPLSSGPRSFLSRLWQRGVTRLADRLLVSTGYMQRELLRNGFDPAAIAVLPMFTGMNEDRAVVPDASAHRRLLFVGRLDRSKGGTDFIEALALLNRDSDWAADVVGEGPMEGEIRARAAAAGIEGRVHLHGRLAARAMSERYAQARILVMPSRIPESFGLAGIEALACGRPVVAYDSGGIGDWLAHGETGYLVGHGDVPDLARRIAALLEDDASVSAMGSAGIARVERLYRAPSHVDALVGHYRAVQEHRRRADMIGGED